jgi:putative oxidoreductase
MTTHVAGQMAAASRSSGSARNAALWVLQVAAALMLGMAGFAKLGGDPQMVGLFEAIGLGQWFRYVTGGLEVAGALLLVVPALAGVGALLLAGVMAGAVLTHLLVVGGSAVVPLGLLAATGAVAWGRRERTLRLVGR